MFILAYIKIENLIIVTYNTREFELVENLQLKYSLSVPPRI